MTPQWGLSFPHVLIQPGTALRIALVDADPDLPLTNGDDPMGIVKIGMEDLLRAAQTGGTYQVPTAVQTNDQVLFIGVSVHVER